MGGKEWRNGLLDRARAGARWLVWKPWRLVAAVAVAVAAVALASGLAASFGGSGGHAGGPSARPGAAASVSRHLPDGWGSWPSVEAAGGRSAGPTGTAAGRGSEGGSQR